MKDEILSSDLLSSRCYAICEHGFSRFGAAVSQGFSLTWCPCHKGSAACTSLESCQEIEGD
jgi:hypothetical protein